MSTATATNTTGNVKSKRDCGCPTTVTLDTATYSACVLDTPTTGVDGDGQACSGTLQVDYGTTWFLLDPSMTENAAPTAAATSGPVTDTPSDDSAFATLSSAAAAESTAAETSSEALSTTSAESSRPSSVTKTSPSPSPRTSSILQTSTKPTRPSPNQLSTTSSCSVSHSPSSSSSSICVSPSSSSSAWSSTRTAIITIPTVIGAVIIIGVASFFYKRRKRFPVPAWSPSAAETMFTTNTPEHHRQTFDIARRGNGDTELDASGACDMNIGEGDGDSYFRDRPRQQSIFFQRPVSYMHLLQSQPQPQPQPQQSLEVAEFQQPSLAEMDHVPPSPYGSSSSTNISNTSYTANANANANTNTNSISNRSLRNNKGVSSQIISHELGLGSE